MSTQPRLTTLLAPGAPADLVTPPTPKAKPKPPAVRRPATAKGDDASRGDEAAAPRTIAPLTAAEVPQNGGSVVMVPPSAPLPEPLPVPRSPEPMTPKALVGLDEQATVRLLGEPSWTEDVPPAKYWQYATPHCVLRVFFFMEMTTQNFRALSYELTSSDDAPNADERCFAQLLAQAPGRQTADGNRIE